MTTDAVDNYYHLQAPSSDLPFKADSTMAITLSRSDYDALWQQANPLAAAAKQADAFDVKLRIPEQLGQGYVQEIQWRGINLMLFDYQFHDDVFVKQAAQDTDCIDREIGFNLSGNRHELCTGESFILWGNNSNAAQIDKTYANEAIQKVDIHLDLSEDLMQMVNETLEALPKTASGQMEIGSQWLAETNAIAPAMQLALKQIW